MRDFAPVLVGVVAGLAVLGAPGRRAGAEEDHTAAKPAGLRYALDASVTAGYRLVDIDGAKGKYKEDYNLRSGGRLFDLDVGGVTTDPAATPLDRFRLQMETPGDEPVSRFRLTASDRTLYDLRADFTRSRYFYRVPQLFAAPVAGDRRTDDLHDFDLTRTNGTVDLTVRAPNLPALFFGYRLYERYGDAISTVSLPAGDTFLVGAPVWSVTNVGQVGTEFDALGTNVFLEQEFRHVDRRQDLGPVRSPRGLDPGDGSSLSFLDRDLDERLDIPATTVRVRRPLGDHAELRGAYVYSHATLDFDFTKRRTGTTAVPGVPGGEIAAGSGDARLDTHVVDLGTTARLADRVQWHLDYRYNDRSHNGRVDQRSTFGVLAAATGHHVRTHSTTSELEVAPGDTLSLRAGVRYVRRDAKFGQTLQEIATDTVGAVARARWRPWSVLDLFARYEHARVDDPFTVLGNPLANPALPEREVVLTFTNRASAGFQVTPREWVSLRYELSADSRENDTFAARTQGFGNSVGLTLSPLQNLVLFASYTRRDLSAEADILPAPLYQRVLSLQNGTEDIIVTQLRYEFMVRGLVWATGWDVAWVTADTTLRPNLEPGLLGRKVYDVDRLDAGTFLAVRHRLLEPSIEIRWVDYDERVLSRNDYRATIIAFKLTKRLSLR